MAHQQRQRLSREERRAQLIETGRELVESSSFDALSTDAVAQRAGISRGLLFHYFPTRDDFLVALAENAADELLELIAVDPDLAPREQLRNGLAAYVDHVTERRGEYLSLVRGAAGGSRSMQAVFDRTRARLAGRILTALGYDREGAPSVLRHAARGYVAFVEEVVVSWLEDESSDRGEVGRHELLSMLESAGVAVLEAAGMPASALDPPG